MNKKDEVKKIFEAIFESQNRLRALAPEFNWKGMGNMLGDYGEYIGIAEYSLVKAPRGSGNFDALTQEGKTVQIKANHSATQIGFRGEADLLLVIGINSDGSHEEIFYGAFSIAREVATYSARDSKWMIGVNRLKQLNPSKA